MVLYNGNGTSINATDTAWNMQNIEAMFDLETPIWQSEDFCRLCYADTLGDGSVQCKASTYKSPLDLLEEYDIFSKQDLIKAELTQRDLDRILLRSLEDQDMWSKYDSLFDKRVSLDNLKVNFMRTIILLAGPILADVEDPDS